MVPSVSSRTVAGASGLGDPMRRIGLFGLLFPLRPAISPAAATASAIADNSASGKRLRTLERKLVKRRAHRCRLNLRSGRTRLAVSGRHVTAISRATVAPRTGRRFRRRRAAPRPRLRRRRCFPAPRRRRPWRFLRLRRPATGDARASPSRPTAFSRTRPRASSHAATGEAPRRRSASHPGPTRGAPGQRGVLGERLRERRRKLQPFRVGDEM